MLIHESPDVRIDTVDAGTVRLDGGAMFGVVPKPLWSRRIPADERNRIDLAMRCLLVRTAAATLLVDTGVGAKESAKFADIYGIDNHGSPTRLEDSLRALGVEPDQVDHVLLTHLHFDHAGGSTLADSDGTLRPSFPGATYWIRRGEWDVAHLDNPRIRASYLPDNFGPLGQAGVVEFIDGDREIVPGVSAVHMPGHTAYHQGVLLEFGGWTGLYLADLVPTLAHVPLPWIMAYDLDPLTTLEQKTRWLGRAAGGGWTLIFEHDPVVACATAIPAESGDGCDVEDVRDDPDR